MVGVPAATAAAAPAVLAADETESRKPKAPTR